ncbi:hypothetical protein [Maribacter sp. 2308TA10-17]|uniref:hypothetical protein n=1 Tax=Maribacter sp. 2308TA10-17 TaxID=3386276 RepID=UPI0039BCD8D7
MKSSVLITLAFLLATAILAPSVLTLTSIDDSVVTIDFNEEEKKEEGKEKDFFLNANFNSLAQFKCEKITISSFYLEKIYTTSLSILLPPPEFIA